MSPAQIDIVIPVYNEAGSIRTTLQEIRSKVSILHRILIVYDFPEDNTLPEVKIFKAENPGYQIDFVQNLYGRGALNAIKSGLSLAQAEAVLVVMADSSDDLSAVDRMYQQIQDGAAVVCGSRYCKGGQQIGGPLFKKMLSRLAGVSLHYLVGLPTKDATNSFKMYRTSFVQGLKIESTGGFEVGIEIVVKAFLAKETINEVPSTWRDRVAGESRFRLWKWLPHYLHWYCKAFRAMR